MKGFHKKQLHKTINRNVKTIAVIREGKHVANPNLLVIRRGSTLNAPDLQAQG